MKLFDRTALFAELRRRDHGQWADELRSLCDERFSPDHHGTMSQWMAAWERLPPPHDFQLDTSNDKVAIVHTPCADGELTEQAQHNNLRPDELQALLMQLHPWRKGPFEAFGLNIDTEWRSDWKWNRIKDAIDFRNKSILDIGCGNGYYGWKMLAAGADWIVGCDPFLLYVAQFEVFRKYASKPEKHFVLPIGDHEIAPRLALFDIVVSMGVLYHRTSPIDHLQTLWNSLRPGGQVLLETLIITSDTCDVLVPEGRYAKMRNVWFIPSVPMLERWLYRTGFRDVEVVQITPTTGDEQRRTDWMTFESLADFLDPENPQQTIEGYPGPVRAILTAKRR